MKIFLTYLLEPFFEEMDFEFHSPYQKHIKGFFLFFKIFKIWKRQWIPLIKTINLSYWWARFDIRQEIKKLGPVQICRFLRIDRKKWHFSVLRKVGKILLSQTLILMWKNQKKILAQKSFFLLKSFFEEIEVFSFSLYFSIKGE